MSDHTITTEEQLRAIIGSPHPMVQLKVVSELNEITSDFIRRSPFIVLATADREGNQDASPRAIIPGLSPSRTPRLCAPPSSMPSGFSATTGGRTAAPGRVSPLAYMIKSIS
jgi:predicted pyridoxine 5'-phosphate oxidase superfamily flavin-nucleotide-binding protein